MENESTTNGKTKKQISTSTVQTKVEDEETEIQEYNFDSEEMKTKLWREGTDWLQLEIKNFEREVEFIDKILKQKTSEGSEKSSLQSKKKKLNVLITKYCKRN